MVNLDYLHEIYIVRYPEWLKFQFHTPLKWWSKKINRLKLWTPLVVWYLLPELLGLRVVNGCPRCTLCGNDLTPNVLRTKNLPVLKHPATARLRRRWYGSSYSAYASASMSFRIQHSLRHPNGIFSTRFSSFDTPFENDGAIKKNHLKLQTLLYAYFWRLPLIFYYLLFLFFEGIVLTGYTFLSLRAHAITPDLLAIVYSSLILNPLSSRPPCCRGFGSKCVYLSHTNGSCCVSLVFAQGSSAVHLWY